MIKHDIIKYTTRVPISSVHTPNRSVSAEPALHCQADLDNWIKDTEFQIGKWVIFGSSQLQRSYAHSAKEIIAHQTDYDQLQRRAYHPYQPLVMFVQPLGLDAKGVRLAPFWEDVRGLYVVNDIDYLQYIKPLYDQIRYHSQPST
jgi:hypothetical protein